MRAIFLALLLLSSVCSADSFDLGAPFIIFGKENPQVTPTAAPRGWLYQSTIGSQGRLFTKQDNGKTTNWVELQGAGGGGGVTSVNGMTGAVFLNYINTIIGDATSGPVSASTVTLTLNNVVTAGTNTKITYNSKGLVIAGAGLSAADIPSLSTIYVTSVNGQVGGATVVNAINQLTGDGTAGPAVGSMSQVFTLASIVTAGTNTKITYNAKGQVIAGSSLSSVDIPLLIGSSTTGNASTASLFDHNPIDCGASTFAIAIDSAGNLTCAPTIGTTAIWGYITGDIHNQLDLESALEGASTTLWGGITGDINEQTDLQDVLAGKLGISDNAVSATQLLDDPVDCSGDTFAQAIANNGDLTCAGIPNVATTGTPDDVPDTIVLRDTFGSFAAYEITADYGARINTTVTQPTCTDDIRGLIWAIRLGGDAGNDDLQICDHNTGDDPVWHTIGSNNVDSGTYEAELNGFSGFDGGGFPFYPHWIRSGLGVTVSGNLTWSWNVENEPTLFSMTLPHPPGYADNNPSSVSGTGSCITTAGDGNNLLIDYSNGSGKAWFHAKSSNTSEQTCGFVLTFDLVP